ncbi:hypothetical protein [Variovorax rhizosphaerae]|uniref:Uncharacterized protein n=1 Tax=Variovorax rhizosphaerae TaxID=1836200 RepID=A0ABU8WL87_9BURK
MNNQNNTTTAASSAMRPSRTKEAWMALLPGAVLDDMATTLTTLRAAGTVSFAGAT